jgi:ABC-type iron transport system FetAB permease component
MEILKLISIIDVASAIQVNLLVIHTLTRIRIKKYLIMIPDSLLGRSIISRALCHKRVTENFHRRSHEAWANRNRT